VKIAVLGSSSQLGTNLMKVLSEDHEVIGLTHQNIEVTNYESYLTLKEITPTSS
jgi:dTDP-4-dehydrorhamnose reductase